MARRQFWIGLKPGVVDYLLPVARGGWHSLWFDMKRGNFGPKEKAPDDEHAWLAKMREQGHATALTRGAIQGRELLTAYLKEGQVPAHLVYPYLTPL